MNSVAYDIGISDVDPKFQAFPTYPLIMGFKGTEIDVIDFYEKASARFPPGLPKMGLQLDSLSNDS